MTAPKNAHGWRQTAWSVQRFHLRIAPSGRGGGSSPARDMSGASRSGPPESRLDPQMGPSSPEPILRALGGEDEVVLDVLEGVVLDPLGDGIRKITVTGNSENDE